MAHPQLWLEQQEEAALPQRQAVRLTGRMVHLALDQRADKGVARRAPSQCGTMPLLSSSGCCSAARCAPSQLSAGLFLENARAGW